MLGNRLLNIACVLIGVGTFGIFSTAWLGGPHFFYYGVVWVMMGKGGMDKVMNEMMSRMIL